jgi:uncharacterized RDD family membrane protein YckC
MNHRVVATPAALGLRLLAGVYDLLPLFGLWSLAGALALALTGGALDPHQIADKLLVQTIALALTAAYFVISWTRGGQTLGMRAWRLRVVRADGSSIASATALLRFAVALISFGVAGIGFLWASFDGQRRTWHDIAAGTLMVRMENNT